MGGPAGAPGAGTTAGTGASCRAGRSGALRHDRQDRTAEAAGRPQEPGPSHGSGVRGPEAQAPRFLTGVTRTLINAYPRRQRPRRALGGRLRHRLDRGRPGPVPLDRQGGELVEGQWPGRRRRGRRRPLLGPDLLLACQRHALRRHRRWRDLHRPRHRPSGASTSAPTDAASSTATRPDPTHGRGRGHSGPRPRSADRFCVAFSGSTVPAATARVPALRAPDPPPCSGRPAACSCAAAIVPVTGRSGPAGRRRPR